MWPRRIRGVTLLECAVVVVIVALLTGVVMVGRNMTDAARVRAQVSQYERISTAVGAFRLKYASLPGDLPASVAARLGYVARSGTPGHGDGNWHMGSCEETCGGVCPIMPLGCEVVLFWSDLERAQVLNASFPRAVDDYVQASSFADTLGYFPEAALGGSTLHPTECAKSELWLVAIRITRSTLSGGGGSVKQKPHVRASEAFQVDSKLDDGLAKSGDVRANDTGGSTAEGYYCDVPSPPTTCVDSEGEYDAASDAGRCQVNYRIVTR